MDLGLAFDDEDLQSNKRAKDKSGDLNLPYNVKICTPKWFESAYTSICHDRMIESVVAETDLDQLQQMIKFDADLQYRHRNYSCAAQRYEKMLDMLLPSNVSVRHDVKESLSRCYAYLGLVDKSLLLAHDIMEGISKEDPKYRQSLILLSFVYEQFERWDECVEILENICQLHPLFPQLWHKLGDVYSHLKSSKSTSVTAPPIGCLNSVKQLTCYLRARYLLFSVMGTVSELVKNRNQATILELSKKIEKIPLPESEKTYAIQFIDKEIEQSTATKKEDLPELHESNSQPSHELFYSQFCSWHIHYNKKI